MVLGGRRLKIYVSSLPAVTPSVPERLSPLAVAALLKVPALTSYFV